MNLDRVLIEQCAPTLAGIKTANLFKVAYVNYESLKVNIELLNSKFLNKGISFKILKVNKTNALIYTYRESMLKKDIANKKAKNILNVYGYNELDINKSLERLKKRLENYKEFPHEIGIFLGYPPEDVEGFIFNKGYNCNLCGYWKVYGDVSSAKIEFAKFDKCRAIYKRLWQAGKDIMLLAVKKQIVT